MSLEDRKRIVDSMDVESVADVRAWQKLCSLDIWIIEVWMSACNVVVAGVICVDRGRKTCRDCVKDNM